jgi:hypothetical protein
VADDARRRWLGGEAALGGLLVLLGLVVLLGQAVDVEVGRVAWPVFVIVPGLGLLGLGLASAGRLGEVPATVGGVVTMAGLAPADQVVCRVAEGCDPLLVRFDVDPGTFHDLAARGW